MKILNIFEMSALSLNNAEKVIDNMFRDIGLDIVFTSHFKNRILDPNDPTRRDNEKNSESRAYQNITPEEIINMFTELKNKYGRKLYGARQNPEEFVGILKDATTSLNIPFAIDYERLHERLHKLYAMTVMRKKNFKPNRNGGKIFTVNT